MAIERKRDGGIEAPAWWLTEAGNRRRDQGITQEALAVLVAGQLGVDAVEQSRVSRCLRGVTSTVPMLEAISSVLGIPPPVFVAATIEEAREVSAVQRTVRDRSRILAAADRQLAKHREAAVGLRQRESVQTGHGGEAGRTAGGLASRRRNAGAA